jgi:hypothetical protein
MKQLKAALWTKWRALVSEQGQSGQTVSAFCRDRGLRDSHCCDWKKRIREDEAAKDVIRLSVSCFTSWFGSEIRKIYK